MSVLQRVGKGMGAYSYAQLVTVSTQILGLPIFLYFWSLEEYGTWLMLSAIPVYFAMSDLGMVAVAGNKMTMAIANNEITEGNRIFQSAFLMTVGMILLVLIVSINVVVICDIGLLSKIENKIVLLLLIAASLLNILGGLIDAIFRASGEYARGTYLVTTARLFEWFFTIFAVYLYKDIVFAAIGYLLGRLLMTIFNFFYTNNRHKHFSWSFRFAEWSLIKEMLKPSLAFMALPISNALSIQGLTLVVGTFLGPATVVYFNTYRTLSRFLIQGAFIINKPLWPEFSRLFGLGDISEIRRYYNISIIATTAFMLMGFIFLYYSSDYIFEYWTSGKVTVMGEVYYPMLLAAFIAGLTQVSTTILSATNLHTQYFLFILLLSIFSIFISYFGIEKFGLVGISTILVFTETILLLASSLFVFQKIFFKDNKNISKAY
jgi:O-antigen/teichoic acid export membrane protein